MKMGIVGSKPTITRKELEGVLDCMIQDELTTGTTVKKLEAHCGQMTGMKFSLATSSHTAAYHLAFKALDILPGDEVIIPSFFNSAPLSALQLCGARPVLVDIDDGAFSPSAEQISELISEHTRGVVLGHLFGFPLDMDLFSQLNIPVIEDISHIFGKDPGEDVSIFKGSILVSSFSPEMMITTGNGGMVFTGNSRYYSQIRDYRNGSPSAAIPGFDYAMTDLQGAMGISQVLKIKNFIKRRKDIAKIYYDALQKTPHQSIYSFNDDFTYQSFPILFDSIPEKIEKFWKKQNIQIFRPVQPALHDYCELRGLDYPRSDRFSKKLFSLPIYPTLTRKEIEKVARALSMFV